VLAHEGRQFAHRPDGDVQPFIPRALRFEIERCDNLEALLLEAPIGEQRRAEVADAATGVLLGVILISWMTFSPKWTGALAAWRSPFHSFLITVFGTLAILLVGLLLSRGHRRPAAGPAAPGAGDSTRRI
jgi:hypothetical protein